MGQTTATAVAYLRTSSAANVGEDKDSAQRQRDAIVAYARRAGLEVVEQFYDAAVSGADPIHERPGFANLLDYIAGNGARIVLVEDASRFARDLIVQLTGHELLKERGIELIPVNAPDYFTDETPTARMVQQILGAVSEFEKANLVSKLRKARERKRQETGRCEGRKPLSETAPDTVALARRLYRRNPVTGHKRSLRQIGTLLAQGGHLNARGKPYDAKAVSRMLG